ncbi:DUF2383 domain-containing protein [Mangrovibacterium sp.]|uniref:DUF2383 domain-containing protein n=1 Tax=Mangrovibacterium sp. TaxID=1961364 RepID=UPI003565B481
MKTAKLRNDLQQVIKKCKDSADIYLWAADNSKSEDLQNALLLFALKRKNFIELLRREARKGNIDLFENSSFTGILQKTMHIVIGYIGSTNDDQLIETCRTAEAKLVDLYDEVLTNEDLPMNLYRLLVEHQQLILSNLNRLQYVPAHA